MPLSNKEITLTTHDPANGKLVCNVTCDDTSDMNKRLLEIQRYCINSKKPVILIIWYDGEPDHTYHFRGSKVA